MCRQDGMTAVGGNAGGEIRQLSASGLPRCTGINMARTVVVLAIIAMVTSSILGYKQVGCFSRLPNAGQYALYAVSGAAVIGLAINMCMDRKRPQTGLLNDPIMEGAMSCCLLNICLTGS
ncbi:MAG: hypothetical protein ACKVOH_04550 [Chlamydiales bacterium]